MHPRSRPRVAVDYPVLFTGDKVSGHGLLKNLTIAGSEIESHVKFSLGAHLCLKVEPSGARPPIVIALAVVRWNQGDRFGLEFVRFEGDAKRQLEDMLNQRDGSSSK
jgi:hypothetical protein